MSMIKCRIKLIYYLIKQLNGDKILEAKIYPDLEKIAQKKSKIILNELIKPSR